MFLPTRYCWIFLFHPLVQLRTGSLKDCIQSLTEPAGSVKDCIHHKRFRSTITCLFVHLYTIKGFTVWIQSKWSYSVYCRLVQYSTLTCHGYSIHYRTMFLEKSYHLWYSITLWRKKNNTLIGPHLLWYLILQEVTESVRQHNRDLKHALFWETDGNWKQAVFFFAFSSHNQIYIVKYLSSIIDV